MALCRLCGAPCEDAFEFLISCEGRLHNLGLVGTHGVNYTTFQLDLVVIIGVEVIFIPVQLDLPICHGLSSLRSSYRSICLAVLGII